MGLLTKGLLSISVFKVRTTAGLAGIVSAANQRRYPETPTKPSEGWGSLSDDETLAAKDGVRLDLKSYTVSVATNHNSTPIVALRYYYDEPDPSLIKRFGDSDWRRTSNRGAFDVFLLDENQPDELTALVATRNDVEVTNYARPALTELVSDEVPPGSITSASITEELDPDFFLWLLYMLHKNLRIAPNVKLSGILDMSGVFVGRRSHLSQGVDMYREDSLALVARNRSKLGPAKIAITHYAEPEGYFELQLFPDSGFQVYRKSKYDDKELKKLPVSLSGQRMVQDVWQTLLPTIRATYSADAEWRSKHRSEFVNWAKEELKKF
ncbi:hypothetical protein [Mycolicibacterium fortuitum]|uniref:Uncharacterized protein n=1 Tax=Mycolicibacterium fortuitum subsp. fortuitum DSM 46621 = ATCC 6841 = JCM 6387 TaxID=1214102 RepID=K0V9L1_MYCFO|nr:hypothetical protein [Mycolicibacterium fortuitum]CRL79621.1 hypothetical protein CPGR_02816 [Mycolicibacter nonchromogenicus]EJZ15782.1 hypothetical protein MFORT_02694 [Mycolicibacterium fortuitum subsp. fortuitum DSM 46621 = ATCC 6841 = JCM 6387]WEV33448.1 hypothetical protein OMF10_03255 [Mycolicibacterium fortuitum]CRL54794.1 hypothetical protein CPGR_02091 [Mycolicibacterium fortuitum subsp. fortuitum DSM 46621 = ATCC 6841 = JCM 6387]BDD96555.1 hypothetical protein MFTT_06490 [Mycolic